MTYKTSLKKHFIKWQKAVDIRTMREEQRGCWHQDHEMCSGLIYKRKKKIQSVPLLGFDPHSPVWQATALPTTHLCIVT